VKRFSEKKREKTKPRALRRFEERLKGSGATSSPTLPFAESRGKCLERFRKGVKRFSEKKRVKTKA